MPRFARPAARLAAAVLFLPLAACSPEAPPLPGSAAEAAAADSLLASRYPLPVSLSPDGDRLLLKDVAGGRFRLLAVGRGGSDTVVLHRGRGSQMHAAWRDDGGAVAFVSDRGGDQQYRAYVADAGSPGRVREVRGPGSDAVSALRWAPGGGRLAYVGGTLGVASRRLFVASERDGLRARAVLDGVARSSDVAWAPDGASLAVVRVAEPGVLALVEPDGGIRRLPVAPGARVREMAWSPDGRSILVALRRGREEHFSLAEVEVAGGRVRTVARPRGDVARPLYLPDGSGLVYHVNRDSELKPVVCARDGSGCRGIAPLEGSVSVLGFTRAGRAVVSVAGRTAPPSLHEADPASGRVWPASTPPPPDPAAVAGERVDVPAPDGLRVPAFLWRAPRLPGREPAAVVVVHGGPAIQSARAWDGGIQYLVRAGVHVLSVNYRGSSGYGARFEGTRWGEAAQAADVLAARDFLVRRLGVRADRVVLLGHSYGARLAARAASDGGAAGGGVVLVSLLGGGELPGPRGPLPRRVAAIHARNDLLQPPGRAREQLRRWLGRRGAGRLHFRVLPDEGHFFARTGSWAEVYAAAAALAAEAP